MKVLLLCVVAALPLACGGGNPAAPDGLPALTEWSPYLGVHPFGSCAEDQLPYLETLMDRGALRGVRIDLNNRDAECFARWVTAQGGDVLAIFSNEHLRSPNVWDVLKEQMARNPDIRYWEIGNEIDVFTNITVAEYLPVFLDLHRRAGEEFPDRVVIPQAPCGGCQGAAHVREMMDGGLLSLAHQGRLPVVSVHYYSLHSTYLGDIKTQIERLPPSTQVWVTETGIPDVGRHVEHVRTEYPRIRSMVRATRIYWYVFAECSELSLVQGLASPCAVSPPQPSPLYMLLTGGQR
jgi:hypothetical protein